MKALWISFVLIVLSGSLPAADSKAFGTQKPASDAEEYFRAHLAQCPKNEVRCLWFGGDLPNAGIVLTFDLQKTTSFTVYDGYGWARQAAKTRELNFFHMRAVKEVVSQLQETTSDAPFAACLHIAFWKTDKLVTASFRRSEVPIDVRRLYDIAGADSGFVYVQPKVQSK